MKCREARVSAGSRQRDQAMHGRPAAPARHLLATPAPLPTGRPALQINVLLLSSVGVVLPIRLYLPCQFPSLLLMLRATAQRCLQECGSDSGSALAAGTCSAGISGPGPAGDSCVAGSQAAVRYYSTAAKWIRKLNPHCLGRLPARWRPGGTVAGTCLGTCFAVQSWLQVGLRDLVGGVGQGLALVCFGALPLHVGSQPPISSSGLTRLLPAHRSCRRWAACCSRWRCCGSGRSGCVPGSYASGSSSYGCSTSSCSSRESSRQTQQQQQRHVRSKQASSLRSQSRSCWPGLPSVAGPSGC